MASKSKRRILVQKKAVVRRHHSPKKCQSNARRSVTKRAPTSEEECPMRFCVCLNGSNHWYLHSFGSCLDHKHHPKLDVAANTLSEKDQSDAVLKLTNLLYDVNVPLSTIAKVLTTLRDDIIFGRISITVTMQCQLLLLSPSIVTSSTRQKHQHSITPAGCYC